MSECSRVKPMLPGLLNQELSSSDINEVQAHLSRCVQCREHMSGLPFFQNANLQ
jgi:predicted anti-sigma-YlaC factor YlaD